MPTLKINIASNGRVCDSCHFKKMARLVRFQGLCVLFNKDLEGNGDYPIMSSLRCNECLNAEINPQ